MGEAGFLGYAVPKDGRFDVRSLCILRETFARFDGLADFAFAMQGLGSGAITLAADASSGIACCRACGPERRLPLSR